ncbi:MBL fold metallo-hydrolase [Treponema phagedenis]|uniref:Metallo-beta-lactamase domain protein n=1 Tax=Treponema phagedenis TaxID=162 RepID=A0A0B7GS66_TREPH|nr:MBL fold metallo-hydrolase [Treponema phagedenis]QEJ95455.1 MBL fold metallo-hydrolase [Treponema phagedenis]QSH93480.1 MBL fold metallo-hydrolase [Treponema phagedenis]QSH99754.1 MBL fold metallo-hydrolase [Treponema phagedenis]CEM60357.1 Metallo-beta-lactamase domain protein [Treponema phagedenis]
MRLEILGSGTSHGIPVIGCNCSVCTSADPRDTRYRASAWIRPKNNSEKPSILIDCGPEFRLQALRAGMQNLDAVLLTHSHADHVHGLDDLRIFSYKTSLPIYLEKYCAEDIKKRFSYVFTHAYEGGGIPHFSLHVIEDSNPVFYLKGVRIEAIPLIHGRIIDFGWRIKNTAYLTDCNFIPDSSFEKLKGLKNLIIDGLRVRKHITHFCFAESLDAIKRIAPQKAWLTHICHDVSHKEICAIIEEAQQNDPELAKIKISPAYDGLIIDDLD